MLKRLCCEYSRTIGNRVALREGGHENARVGSCASACGTAVNGWVPMQGNAGRKMCVASFFCAGDGLVPCSTPEMTFSAEFDFLHDEAMAARLAKAGVRLADCDERFILGRGPGGQKINKTSSTVQLLHRPSGIEVRMQRERSQTRNRELAWAELATRLEERLRSVQAVERDQRELERRRTRQRSRAQKARMLSGKKHRAKRKANRRGGFDD